FLKVRPGLNEGSLECFDPVEPAPPFPALEGLVPFRLGQEELLPQRRAYIDLASTEYEAQDHQPDGEYHQLRDGEEENCRGDEGQIGNGHEAVTLELGSSRLRARLRRLLRQNRHEPRPVRQPDSLN